MSKPYRRTPAGLLLPLHATLAGRVRWQVLDERGVPEVPRTPSGIPVGPVEGVEQPNLITDAGQDRMAAQDLFNTGTGSQYRGHLAVGTGSTAPEASDVSLDNEVQRASSTGGFGPTADLFELDSVANVWRAVTTVHRVVTMTADRNLTEFGLSHGASTDVSIRELLRDGGGTPITVSLLNGKTLYLTHALNVEIPAPAAGISASINIEEYDAGNNLVNTIPVDITHGGHDSGGSVNSIFSRWNPVQNPNGARVVNTDAVTYARSDAFVNDDLTPSPAATTQGFGSGNVSLATYTTGSFQRIKRVTVPVSDANFAWHGFLWAAHSTSPGGTNTRRTGWLVLFDSTDAYTKQNTDTLRVGIVSTWARA